MRIIDDWQYKFIERCLYNHAELKTSELITEMQMAVAIAEAQCFFKGKHHETMMEEFYFKADDYRKTMTGAEHFRFVCEKILFTEEPNGYVIRREIVYRVAMNCYKHGVFR